MKLIQIICLLPVTSFLSFCSKPEQITKQQVGIRLINANTSSTIYLYQNEIDAKPIDSISLKVKNNGSTKIVTAIDLESYTFLKVILMMKEIKISKWVWFTLVQP